MARETDPSLNRRRLRIELRRARDAQGLSQRDAADALEWSLSKLIRIEAGTVSVSVTDLRALLQQYEIADADLVSELEDAARGSKGASWWAEYSDMLNPQFAQYLSYEGAATTLRAYNPVVFPALLQSEDYAEALMQGGTTTADVRRGVDLRITRQERLLEAADGPELHFVVDESVFLRQIGGPQVMRRQLQFIAERAQHPRVRIQLLPFTAGAYFGTSSPFVLLTFKDEDDLLYLESMTGSMANRDDVALTSRYQESFETISAIGQEGEQLLERIATIRAGMSND